MVTVTHEVAQKVSCVVCGKEKFAMKAPYICHGCWESGEAALMIQRLTQRAPDLKRAAANADSESNPAVSSG
jgi:hypothetical protein